MYLAIARVVSWDFAMRTSFVPDRFNFEKFETKGARGGAGEERKRERNGIPLGTLSRLAFRASFAKHATRSKGGVFPTKGAWSV